MSKSVYVPSPEAIFRREQRNRDANTHNRDRALLLHATELSIQSLLKHGVDLPVGSVAAAGDKIVGNYYASDVRLNHPDLHAERMAVYDARIRNQHVKESLPDTVVVSLEPCSSCQDFLATHPNITRVGFGLSRKDASDRGLVKPREETIFERAERVELPYQVVQIEDPALRQLGLFVLDHVERDLETGIVQVNDSGLRQALQALEAI